jgi:hypothetical protein
VLSGRTRVPGLLVLLTVTVATTACTGGESPQRLKRADVAVQSYAAPSGAPGYCASLAGSTHLTDVAVALGTLTARPGDVEAKLALTAAAEDLRAVDDELTEDDAALDAALEELAAALDRAEQGPITDSVRAAVSGGLDDVGRLVQPVCDFPA